MWRYFWLVRFFRGWRCIWRINFLGHGAGCQRWLLEVSRILTRHRHGHKIHPDWQGSVRSRFFGSQRFLLVVADPDTAGHGRRESHDPRVGEIIGRPGLARRGKWQPERGDPRAV